MGGRVPENTHVDAPLVSKEDFECYLETKKCVEELALYLKSSLCPENGLTQNNGPLSRPMQRKLVTLINCQLMEEEGRARGMRAARSLGERSVTELILQHQNPQHLSVNLWAAVRARGCQFLGPAMQEEVLKLVLLALEDGSALSRKVLVMFVVQRLAPHFPQASKTSIGHVVQLLYRASCFKVSKREEDSSLMQLKEELCTYEALRKEHDTQIVQIATEAGLRIAPEQWSSLLYGDTAHKSHMQSLIDKLQTPQSFSQSVQELIIALQRTGDPGNLFILKPHLELLAAIDPSPDGPAPAWKDLKCAQEAAKIVVKGLVDFVQNFGNRKLQEDRHALNTKYKTSMCRDLSQHGSCPRGAICTFAHSEEELEKYRSKARCQMGNRARNHDVSLGRKKYSVSSTSSSSVLSSSVPSVSECNPGGQLLAEIVSCPVPSNSYMLNQPSTSKALSQRKPDYQTMNLSFLQQNDQKPSSYLSMHKSFLSLESQTLAGLQQRKKELLTQLNEAKCNTLQPPGSQNGTMTSSRVEISFYPSDAMSDSYEIYSPWTSSGISLHNSITHCDYMMRSSSSSESSEPKENAEIGFCEVHGSVCPPFCPSEKDEFIPFYPPLVSKYGPISRCAKGLIRGPAPIQVSALSQMGDVTTSAMQRPLSSPTFFVAPSRAARSESFWPQENLEMIDGLREELWAIEKSIRAKESAKDVPTSIGPWPSQTLENLSFQG